MLFYLWQSLLRANIHVSEALYIPEYFPNILTRLIWISINV
ncbi:hypothetical protein [Shewanella surugensis]|nr:hypothetical protein [Shewanella surugensis]